MTTNLLVDSGIWINDYIEFGVYDKIKPIAKVKYSNNINGKVELEPEYNNDITIEKIRDFVNNQYPRLIYLVTSGDYKEAKIQYRNPICRIPNNNFLYLTIFFLLVLLVITNYDKLKI